MSGTHGLRLNEGKRFTQKNKINVQITLVLVSSAYVSVVAYSSQSSKSLTYITNANGEKFTPCGTPDSSSLLFDKVRPILTFCDLPVRN